MKTFIRKIRQRFTPPALKRLLKIGLYLFGALLLLMLIGYGLLQTAAVQAAIKNRLIKAVEARVDARLHIDGISGNLLSTLSFDGIQLQKDGRRIASIERLAVVYSLPMLLNQTIWVNRLYIRGLHLAGDRKADGTWHLIGMDPPSKSTSDKSGTQPKGPPFDLVIKAFRLQDAVLETAPAPDAPAWLVRIEKLHSRLTIDRDGLLSADIKQLAYAVGESPPMTGRLKGRIRYDTAGQLLQVQSLQLGTEASRLILDARLDMGGAAPELEADLGLSPLSLAELSRLVGDFPLRTGTVEGNVHVQGTPAEIHHRIGLRYQQQEISFQGTARYAADGRLAVDTHGTGTHLDPMVWLSPDGQPTEKSDLNLEFDLATEKLLDPLRQVNLTLEFRESTIAGYPLNSGGIQIDYTRTGLDVRATRLVSPLGRLEMSAQVSGLPPGQAQQLQAEVRLVDVELSRLWPDHYPAAKVSADIHVDAQGPLGPESGLDYGQWTAAGEVRVHSAVIAGAAVESAEIRTAWNGRSLSLNSFRLSSEPLQANVTGSYAPADGSFQLAGTTTLADLQRLATVLQSFHIEMVDEIRPAGDLLVTGSVQGNRQGRYRIDASGRSGRLTVDDASLSQTSFEGHLDVGLEDVGGRLRGTIAQLEYGQQQFNRLSIDSQLSDNRINADLSTRHELGSIDLAGRLENWRAPVKTITLQTLRIEPESAPADPLSYEAIRNTTPVRIHLQPAGVDIESFALASEMGRLAVSGRIDDSGRQNLTIEIETVSTTTLNRLMANDVLPEGLLSARLDLSGTMADPRFDGRVDLKPDRRTSNATPDFRLTFDYDHQRLAAHLTAGPSDPALLSIKGKIGLQLALRPFNMRLVGDSLEAEMVLNGLQLSTLPLPESFQRTVGGAITARVDASGDPFSPQVSGDITVADGRLAFADLEMQYHPVLLELKLSPGRIHIERLRFEGKDDRFLSGEGSIDLDGFSPTAFDLHLTGKRLNVPYKRAITTRLDPELDLRGTLEAPQLSGRIEVHEARINLDRMLADGPAEIEVIRENEGADRGDEIIRGPADSDGFWDRLAVDLDVAARRNVWLKGEGVDAEIFGNIKVRKKARESTRLVGELETRRGLYDFYGRRFNITQGRVEFIGAPEPDPLLDIVAETRISDVTILLNISRQDGKIQVEMSSRPPMPESDIISYLVFGRPTDELRGQQSAGVESSAISITGKMAASELERILSQTGLVDVFTIDLEGEDITSGSATVGKYVTRDIFVIYRYAFSADTPDEVEVDYQLNKNFSLQSQYGNEQTTGVDLIWQHDFNSINPFGD